MKIVNNTKPCTVFYYKTINGFTLVQDRGSRVRPSQIAF